MRSVLQKAGLYHVFVLVVQSFEKLPALQAIAPTQKEPPCAIAQIAVLMVFILMTVLAVKKFRPGPTSTEKSQGTAA
jgi:hypothetical protein